MIICMVINITVSIVGIFLRFLGMILEGVFELYNVADMLKKSGFCLFMLSLFCFMILGLIQLWSMIL